jgi:hypothetical protein
VFPTSVDLKNALARAASKPQMNLEQVPPIQEG